jgi:hypothetical protein
LGWWLAPSYHTEPFKPAGAIDSKRGEHVSEVYLVYRRRAPALIPIAAMLRR